MSTSSGNATKTRVAFVFTHRIQYFTNLLEELQRRGQIEVAAFYAHETAHIDDIGFDRRITWDNRPNVSYQETVCQRTERRPLGPFFNSFATEIFASLNAFSPNLVHLNGYNAAIQWLGWAWAIAHRLPIIARGDGDMLDARTRPGWAPQQLLARQFAKRVTHVLYQGRENFAFWETRGAVPSRMSWIPCVSDSDVFRAAAFTTDRDRNEFRAAHGVGPADVVFLVAGKLETRKRPGDAIKALASCGSDAARLWFVGSGPLRDELVALAQEEKVQDRITWFGFKNQSEMPAVLQAADVLLHPSQHDPWPYSVLEGAASSLALLLSDRVGSHPDLISNAGAGLTFRCGDIEDIARQMNFIARHGETRIEFRTSARIAAARYTEAAFCQRFEDVVASLQTETSRSCG